MFIKMDGWVHKMLSLVPLKYSPYYLLPARDGLGYCVEVVSKRKGMM